ncbi:MAG: hypothetical protein SFZ23_14540 [Planctomycetota bacterium]|nr:hypothetical protein [Planctomycetota bacterium]
MTTRNTNSARAAHLDEFYVGYLPLPAGHGAFLRRLLVGGVLLVAVVALMALAQRSPGRGVWHDAAPREWVGTLVASPYPMLVVASEPRDEARPSAEPWRTMLLVEAGKHGSQPRTRDLNSARVRVKGFLIERDGRRLIELAPGDDALTRLDDVPPEKASELDTTPSLISSDTALVGELLDAKCFLGAMKPGDRRAHAGCARLCIAGGIPPLLGTRGPDGVARVVLVASILDDGLAPLQAAHLPLVGQPARYQGAVYRVGDLEILVTERADRVPRAAMLASRESLCNFSEPATRE